MFKFDDTICAPATAVGTGAISVIRVSGPDALKVCDTVVKFRNGAALSSEGYSLKYGTIKDVDDVLVSIFRAPHSYTGEDGVEISCHASSYIVTCILERLIAAGARLAHAGEFTRRAFVNGKMDLAQAEAVADVIAANSEASHRIAMNQLKGGYSSELRGLRDKLVELTALMELELDFSEEEVEFANRAQLSELLEGTLAHIEKLAESFHAGNAVKNGVPVAIVGAVNSGKSTLLNALVGEDRAIVSDIPGTTRDTIEEVMSMDGVAYRFIDTAGIRETDDYVEKIGVSRSFSALSRADVVIGVLDGAAPLKELLSAAKGILAKAAADQTLILVRNKVDMYDAIAPEEFPKKDMSYGIFDLKYPAFGTYDIDPEKLTSMLDVEAAPCKVIGILDISARTGEGLDVLRAELGKSQQGRFAAASGTLVTSLRHYEALQRAAESLYKVRIGLIQSVPTDLLAEDLRSAISEFNSIFGEITTDDVLGEIFGKFCIGK